MLRGRRSECAVIDRLLERARSARSGVLVLRGEAGIGKTALVDYAIESARDLRVVRTVGFESELEFAFAAVHQLCVPILERRESLPGPQRDALGVVFGLDAGPAPTRFLVSLAVLSLLSESAAERPLVCVVDDAQWLDGASRQALGFVARRLLAESIVMLVATREAIEDFSGLPELAVEGLREGDARALLRSVVLGPLERVTRRIIAETRGNPLALLELPRGLSSAELAGGFGLPEPMPLAAPIRDHFVRRLEVLPKDTRMLLLIAAVEPVGCPTLVWRAAEQLGIGREALTPAEGAGLLEIRAGVRVCFRHPLVRSAVFLSASPGDQRRAHRALADATDRDVDPARHAWHRAQATVGPDESVAAELEVSAGRVLECGGLAAAAAFLERAVAMTADPARRACRALAAAQAKHMCGARDDAALTLLATAEAGPLDELGHARVDLLRAQIAFASCRGPEARILLPRAARRLEPLDARLARETYLDALIASIFAGGGVPGGDEGVALAALAAAPSPEPPRACDLLLEGFATRATSGYAAAVPKLRRATRAFTAKELSDEEVLRWMWAAGYAAVDVWDDETFEVLAARSVQCACEAGALTLLSFALGIRITAHVCAGELAAAASLVEEQREADDLNGRHPPRYGALVVSAWSGCREETTELIDSITTEVTLRGEGLGYGILHWASAVLWNGLGRHEDAMAAAERVGEHEALFFSNWALVELVLAAARCGEVARAAAALEQLAGTTRASGSEWALGIEAGSRALLSEGDAAERLYLEAIDRLARTRIRIELARAHLHYGEWLRRERRRLDARTHLRTAHTMLAAMGAEAYAERAQRELLATGESVRRRQLEPEEKLTAQEVQVARLARDGLSNPEIGTRLFISRRTAEYHLSKVFTKLHITSRNQLAHVLPSETCSRVAI